MTLPVIAITNESSVLTDDQVQAVIPALQRQVSLDFRGYWDIDCTLTFWPKEKALIKGWWQIVVVDNPDMAGALGYHELNSNGLPLGKVFAKLEMNYGQSWTVTLSHELLEMLVDPWIDTAVVDDVSGKVYALEVADAVEADELGYRIGDVLVSDFVTPRWFNNAIGCDRYSFKQRVSRPFELAPGGYISSYNLVDGWSQIEARNSRFMEQSKRPLPIGSRRERRTRAKSTWRVSEPKAT